MRITNSFQFRRIFCLCCGLFIFMITILNTTIFSHAETNTITQDIFHRHLGSPDSEEGCYTIPIFHKHTGDTTGGGCYSSPNLHQHTGNTSTKGGCYTDPIIHHHSGRSSTNGGCYTVANTHRHSGSSSSGGGCYSVANTHRHSGNSSSGGGCYSVANTHRHSGSSSSKGGCYTVANSHHHTGSSSSGGGCYTTPNVHHHSGNSSTGGGCYVFSHYTSIQVGCDGSAYCSSGPHGPDSSGQFYYVNNCPICGATIQSYGSPAWETCPNSRYQDVPVYTLGCGQTEGQIVSYSLGCNLSEGQILNYKLGCGLNDGQVTSYSLGCGLSDGQITSYSLGCNLNDGQITSYNLGCGLYDGQITGYRLNCGLNDGQITSYSLGCNQTEKTIIGYALGCDMNEDDPVASFSVSKSNNDWATVTDLDLTLSLEDVAQTPNPFSVNDTPVESTYRILENGEYQIILNPLPGYTAEPIIFTIDSIDITPPEISSYSLTPTEWTNTDVTISLDEFHDLQPDGTDGCGLDDNPFSYDGGQTWTDKAAHEYEENGSYEILIRDSLGNKSSISFEINNIDKSAPTLLDYMLSPSEWTNQSILLELGDINDIQPDESEGCGLADKPFSYDNGKTWTKESSHNYDSNGVYEILIRDALGNQSSTSVDINNIDVFEPRIVNVSYDQTPDIDSVTLDIEADDIMPDGNAGSGLDASPFSYDGGSTWTESATFKVFTNSDIVVLVRDKLQNIAQKIISIKNIFVPTQNEDNDSTTTDADDGIDNETDNGIDNETDDGIEDENDNTNPSISSENNDQSDYSDNDDSSDYSDSYDDEDLLNSSDDDSISDSSTLPEKKDTIKPIKPSQSPKSIDNNKSTAVTNEPDDYSQIDDYEPKVEEQIPIEPSASLDNLEKEINDLDSNTNTTISENNTNTSATTNSDMLLKAGLILLLAIAIIGILILILFILCRTVVIYNLVCKDEYKIKGFTFIHNKSDSYEITISENIVNRCDTNRLKISFNVLFTLTHKNDDINIYMPSKDSYLVKPSDSVFIDIRH